MIIFERFRVEISKFRKISIEIYLSLMKYINLLNFFFYIE